MYTTQQLQIDNWHVATAIALACSMGNYYPARMRSRGKVTDVITLITRFLCKLYRVISRRSLFFYHMEKLSK